MLPLGHAQLLNIQNDEDLVVLSMFDLCRQWLRAMYDCQIAAACNDGRGKLDTVSH